MEIVGNAVIQKNGTLVLPQEVIQRLELKFGDELFFVAKGGEITISKLPDAMKRTVDYYLAIGCDRLAAEYYAGGRKRLTGVKANPNFTLTLTYEEREERIYDCKPLLDKSGVFVHLRKYENFARVFIEYGAVCWDIDPNVDSNEVWNNRIDLCPDSCYIDKVLSIIYEVLYDKLEFWRVLTCNSTHTSLRCGLRSSATSETSPKSTLLRWRIFPRSTSAMRCKKVKLALS